MQLVGLSCREWECVHDWKQGALRVSDYGWLWLIEKLLAGGRELMYEDGL